MKEFIMWLILIPIVLIVVGLLCWIVFNDSEVHDAHIYYECSCGAILDPGTKRFAELNNRASEAGWKIRFGETGYTPYCVKCGEKVE